MLMDAEVTAALVDVEKSWAVDVQSEADKMDTAAESQLWRQHSIYRVPACVKDLNAKAYTPQVVAFGPYHHGAEALRAMEEHKRRSAAHFLRRSRQPLGRFAAAVGEALPELVGAYESLDEAWLREPAEEFLRVMIVDGCFMLEVLRTAGAGAAPPDYAANDPIFSAHGILYMVPFIKRDMLMLENQLPLRVLDKLVAVETGKTKNEEYINRLVHKFFAPSEPYVPTGAPGLHPLDVYRKSLLVLQEARRGLRRGKGKEETGGGPEKSAAGRRKQPVVGGEEEESGDIVRSATELYEAGIRLRRSRTNSLRDIRFRHGVLSLPMVVVDDLTEATLRNFTAFERLHVGAGNEVTSYVFFMDNIIDSARDVALLQTKRVIQNAVGSDKAVAKLFNSLSRDISLEPESELEEVQRRVNRYCRQPWNVWRANLLHTYFRSPWAFLSLAAAVFLLALTVAQTVFAVLQWRQGL